MSWSKRQFIEQAFNEAGLASYVFDLSPEQLQSALRQLDAMMATWNGRGIRIGYPLPDSPGASDIDALTDVPDRANEAIYLNLALRIAPGYGRQLMPSTSASAKAAYDVLLSYAAMPPEMQLPKGVPLGAGNKPFVWGRQFTGPPDDPLLAGPDGVIEVS
jgi:hypothetical protein